MSGPLESPGPCRLYNASWPYRRLRERERDAAGLERELELLRVPEVFEAAGFFAAVFFAAERFAGAFLAGAFFAGEEPPPFDSATSLTLVWVRPSYISW